MDIKYHTKDLPAWLMETFEKMQRKHDRTKHDCILSKPPGKNEE